jgi:hypothetical protein
MQRIFASFETPFYTSNVYKKYKFDWVMSYRRDADVFSPYGLVQKRIVVFTSIEKVNSKVIISIISSWHMQQNSKLYCVVTVLSRLLHHKRSRSTIVTNKINNRPQNPPGREITKNGFLLLMRLLFILTICIKNTNSIGLCLIVVMPMCSRRTVSFKNVRKFLRKIIHSITSIE